MGSIDTSSSCFVSVDDFAKNEYDYSILGGGTAGLAIAARLSENPDVTVGVIEAGKNKIGDMLVDTPAMFLQMFGNEDYDWKYKTTPQRGNSGEKQHHMVRGKMLGGSSGINFMMYVRGSDADYDDWAKIVGDESWSSKSMKQYFRKHQTLEPIGPSVTDRTNMPFVKENHGTTGPIHTSFNEWKLDIEDDVVKAADIVTGYTKKPSDPWSGDHIGFYHTLATIGRTGESTGKRSYAANTYLKENALRSNLKVATESLVLRVDLAGDQAVGATFEHAGQEYSVKAKREVIVCGGTVASPQILELSGIGDPAILQRAGVQCKIENKAIGENFQDHVLIGLVQQTKESNDTLDAITRPEVMQQAMKAYQTAGAGPLASTSTVQGFFPFKKFATEEELEDTVTSIENTGIQTDFARRQRETVIAHLRDGNSASLQMMLVGATAGVENSQEDQSTLFAPVGPTDANGVTMICCLQYPVARGSIHIRTANPHDQPEINPAYLRHQADVNVMAAGMRFLGELAETEPLKSKLATRIHPNPELDLTRTEDCKTAVLDWYISEYHPCGSVAMGDALDARLKVRGVKGLRVADASVFPGNVSGNIMSSVYIVAEKAADLINEDWSDARLKSVA